ADPDYAAKLRNLRSMGAVVLILALKRQLLTDGTYWLNLPAASPDKSKSEFPFLALVEHTNYLPREHYGSDHIVYCGDYVLPDHPYMSMDEDTLAELFSGALKRVNPAFSPDWVRRRWVFRAPYAQPIPFVNHSQNIPDLRTPIPGLYLASMSQVYPWDRGTNYAVQIGRQAAARLMGEMK
ncbi:MAG: FAD-dependent oxidoreductase, partial [Anaerolineae bacterium]|nr:FAD-dependent oxidoreductase [Anaerolineae bacterium]